MADTPEQPDISPTFDLVEELDQMGAALEEIDAIVATNVGRAALQGPPLPENVLYGRLLEALSAIEEKARTSRLHIHQAFAAHQPPKKTSEHPELPPELSLFEKVVTIDQLPEVTSDPARETLPLTIEDDRLITLCGNEILFATTADDKLFAFNALLLLRNQPSKLQDYIDLGFWWRHQDQERARVYFRRVFISMCSRLELAAGRSVVSGDASRYKRRYTLDPNLVVTDNRPSLVENP
jgi:hypothetical protein